MVKCKSLVMAMCLLGLLFLTVKPVFATIIDVSYFWYDTGGTWVDPAGSDGGYGIGNTSGTIGVKIQERYDTDLGEYQYTLSNQRTDHNTYRIMYFAVDNPYSTIATDWTEGFISWSSWDSSHTNTSPTQWVWQTSDFTYGANGWGDIDSYRIYTTAPRGLVDGVVKFYANGASVPTYTYTGKVSGPVPEPTSLLLLGGGLLGAALLGGVRKRKI